ncbi:thrombospondin type 3 repeat-containing protein [Roseibacillus ishigakijimensis]|uniref:Uncharacterized protein n=1 Tax=Roseibacillus ishigakijimensis TaxID=454146 RepID=A0A934RJ92_9BACT|nr:thrombospondin type 3 repeat-containing protein [Roseibacillus ishigakijimensis]MBK1832672.1 hypothetical protein [Roseibacillus ishigakijimensis]
MVTFISAFFLFFTTFLAGQGLRVTHVIEEEGDQMVHALDFHSLEGGLTILQQSPTLQPDQWRDAGFWWGLEPDEDLVRWPLFSVAKPSYVPPAAPEPAPTHVTFMLELSPQGLVASWVSLQEPPATDPPQAPEDRYAARAEIRHHFADLPVEEADWLQVPIFAKRFGDYYYTFLLHRTGPGVEVPFNGPLPTADAAMVQHFRSVFPQIAQEVATLSDSSREAPPRPAPSPHARGFWRLRQLQPGDLDSDNDGWSNAREIAEGTNWLNADSDGDGLSDGDPQEDNPLLNEARADPDGANHGSLNSGLVGRWDFESHTGAQTPAAEVTTGAPVAVATGPHAFDGAQVFEGMPSRALHLEGGPWQTGSALSIPSDFLGAHQAYTFSFWLRFPSNPFRHSSQTASQGQWVTGAGSAPPRVYSLMTVTDRSSGTVGTPRFAWVFKLQLAVIANGSYLQRSGAAQSYYLALENWEPGPVATNLAGWEIDQETLTDGNWHLLTLQLEDEGAAAFLDGVALPPHYAVAPANIPPFTFSDDPGQSAFHLGSFGPYNSTLRSHIDNPAFAGGEHGPRQNLAASVDRLRVYRRLLSTSEIAALYHTDIDRDGLLDRTEHHSLRHRDEDGDAILESGEYHWLLNPFVHDAPHLDHDGDGLDSLSEQDGNQPAHGPTDPAQADSDGDGLPDGWESGYGFNPLSPGDVGGNPDGDRLCNSEEYLAGTDPHDSDSDEDGIEDGLNLAPLWLSISRHLQYDYDDYGPEQPNAPKRVETRSGWRAETAETLTAPIPYPALAGRLGQRQPFPSQVTDQGLAKTLTAGGLARTIPGPLCYHAQLTHRRIVVRVEEAATEETPFPALLVRERASGGQAPVVTTEEVTLTIPQGQTQSAPYDLAPSFANAGPNDDSYLERVRETLVPYELISADRMVGGSVTLPRSAEAGAPSWQTVGLRFKAPGGEVLGEYGQFFTPEGPTMFSSDGALFEEFLQAHAAAAAGGGTAQLPELPLVFCARPGQPDTVEFYFLANSYGAVEVELIHEDLGLLGTLTRTLTAEAGLGEYLEAVDALLADYAALPGGGPKALGDFEFQPATVLAGIPALNYLRVIGAPFQGLYSQLHGLYAGFVDGLQDDWELVLLVKDGALALGDALLQVDELYRNLTSLRSQAMLAVLLGKISENFSDAVIAGMPDIKNGLRRLKHLNWKKLFLRPAQAIGELTAQMASQAAAAVRTWYNNLLERLYEESQATVYTEVPWGPANTFIQANSALNYSLGYGCGYIIEQAILGKGLAAAGKFFSKGAARVGAATLTAAKRYLARVGPLLTKYLSNGRATADEAVEMLGSLRDNLRHPLGSPVPAGVPLPPGANPVLSPPVARKPVLEALEEGAEQAGQGAGSNASRIAKKWLDESLDSPNISRNAATRALFHQRLGQMIQILGTRFDDEVGENFMKWYDQFVLDADTATDYFDLVMKAFHSNIGTMRYDNMSAGRADLLEHFLRGSDRSSWRLGFNGSPDVNLGKKIRGSLMQIYEAKHGRYKGKPMLDEVDEKLVEGVDFNLGNGSYAQMKTTQLGSNSTLNLTEELNKAVAAVVERQGERLEFSIYWFEDNGMPDLSSLLTRADTLTDETGIIIDIATIKSTYIDWK